MRVACMLLVGVVCVLGLTIAASIASIDADAVDQAGTEAVLAPEGAEAAVPLEVGVTDASVPQSFDQSAPIAALTSVQRQRLDDLESRPLHQFSNTELGEYLQLDSINREGNRQTAAMTDMAGPAARVKQYALRGLQQPYRKYAMQYDLTEGDCVVFVQRALALSLSRNWDTYYKITERLKHQNGVITYTNRNFLTLSDWVPSNAWLLQNVTQVLMPDGKTPVQSFTMVVRPKKFVEVPTDGGTRTSFVGCDYASMQKEVRIEYYIPTDRVEEVFPYLRDGDVCLVIRRYTRNGMAPWYDCDHMGIIALDATGHVSLVHSAPPKVRQEKLLTFQRLNRHVAGYMFLRLRDDSLTAVNQELFRAGAMIASPQPAELDQKNIAFRSSRSQVQIPLPATRPAQ